MLGENEDVISFFPGSSKKGQVTLGRIVVHDRLKVEAKVLPRYFNHSSFASLRRQLNYFKFTRLGKGRQRGATYCNVGVIELDDILKLKRRSTTAGSSQPTVPVSMLGKRQRSVSLSSSSSSSNDGSHNSQQAKFQRPTVVSPRSTPIHQIEDDEEPRIALDLTVPADATNAQDDYYYPKTHTRSIRRHFPLGGDAEVLAGCQALLCFARGATQELIA